MLKPVLPVAPIGSPRVVVPGSQRLLSVGMPLPELAERPASDDPHWRQYIVLPLWEQA